MSDVIILNKVFEGSWNDVEGNISHEIIDYVLTDKGEQYIYNTPWGHCPEWIYVGENTTPKEKETHRATYLLLTSTTHTVKETGTHNFYINYFVELEEKIHNYSTSKNETTLKNTREKIIAECQKREIKYKGKYLHEIHKVDKSLLVTFKAKRIMKAVKPIEVALSYNFQRNKGYIKNDEHADDYKIIINKIEKGNWENFELKRICDLNYNINDDLTKKNFLDLIHKNDSEECYTNILYSVLSHKNLINEFCKKFKKEKSILNEIKPFVVSRELGIVGGRMDICADNEHQKIVIENKVFSGLNGVRKDESTQLSIYYDWAKKDREHEPLCFLTVPDYRINEIKQEILEKDKEMERIYKIIGYSEIRDFINDHIEELNDAYDYKKYSPDYPAIFNQHSHKTKQEYYTNLFLRAIL